MNTFNFSVKELLGMALKGEMMSKKIYSTLKEKVQNPILKDKFEMLAKEEEKHKIILERFFDTLFHNEEIPIPDEKISILLPKIDFIPATPFVEIIYQAMNFERESHKFYAKLSERFKDERKKILLYLSRVEESHYLMLKGEYEIAQEFEDYPRMKEFDRIVT
jgi:rubrerythrin